MRDLYRRNGLRERESEQVKIHDAAGAAEEREAAFSILLNPRRKPEYDAAHLALSRIGYLRRHMGLVGRDNWRHRYADFLEPEVMAQAGAPVAPKKAHRPWRRLLGWLVIAAVLAAMLVPAALLLFIALERFWN